MSGMVVRVAAGVLLAGGVAALAIGCSARADGASAPVEKTGSSSEALIPST